MLRVYFLLVAVLPTLILGGRIRFRNCKDGGPLPNWAEVVGCDDSSCNIANGNKIVLSAELTTANSASKIKATLNAYIYGIPYYNFDLPPEKKNGCLAFESGCPVAAKETYMIGTEFLVEAPLTNIKPDIELILANEFGARLMCVRTTIRVV